MIKNQTNANMVKIVVNYTDLQQKNHDDL